MCFISWSDRSYSLWNRIDNGCWRYNPKTFLISGYICRKPHLLNVPLTPPCCQVTDTRVYSPYVFGIQSQPGWYQFNENLGNAAFWVMQPLIIGEVKWFFWFDSLLPSPFCIRSNRVWNDRKSKWQVVCPPSAPSRGVSDCRERDRDRVIRP